MAKGVTVDLIVDPKGAIQGLDIAGDKASGFGSALKIAGSVGATAFAVLGTAVVGAAAGLAAATVSAGKYADEILEAATNTNLSTEELQAYRYAAEQMDVSFETFTSSQGKLVKSMQSATAGTGPAAEAFAALGLSVTDSSGNLVDSTELYWQAIDALGGVQNETQRTALAQQIFGKSAAELNSIIAKGSEGFAELRAQAEANGAIMSGPQLEALGAFDDKMQALTSTVDAAKNALGLTLLPVLDSLAGEGTSALGEFTSALLEADGDLTKAGPAFETLGDNLISGLSTAIPKVLQVATSLISGLLQGLVAQAPKLIQAAIPLVVTFVTGILAMLPSLLDAGLQILVALVEGIAAALPELIPAAVEAIIGLVTALVDNLPLLIEAGIQLLLGLALGLIDALPKLIEAIPTIITAIITGLISAIPQLVAVGPTLLIALVKNLPAIIFGIVSIVPKIIEALVKTFMDPKFWKQMADSGVQLIRGLWEGIKSAGDWLWRQMQGFFGGVINNIKKLFGIRSPSTVFAGFGAYMIEGLEKGLTGPNDLNSIMSGLSAQVTDGFQGSLAATARATVATTAKADVAGSGFTADPEIRTLLRTLTDAVRDVEPGYLLPEQLARTNRVGAARNAAFGAA